MSKIFTQDYTDSVNWQWPLSIATKNQCCGSSGPSTASLWQDHVRPCSIAVVTSVRTGRFQGGCHDGSCAARYCFTIFGLPQQSPRISPTSFIVITTAASSAILLLYCWTLLISCSSNRSLELLVIGHSVISSFICFLQMAEYISLP